MLSAALFLLANSLFLTLRLTGDTGSFPKPLSAGEERMYLERSLAGDLEARNILVEHNLRLVAHIIKKYYTQAAEQEDLISIGTIGLIKAVDTFRPERKIRLATYASRCVENEVLMYFRSRKKLQGEVSLSDTIEPDAAGGALSLMDVVGCDDTMLSDMADREERLRIRELVGRCLTDREAEVIRRRYGLSGLPPVLSLFILVSPFLVPAACRKPSARWLRPSASAAAMYPALKSGHCKSWRRR